MYLYQVCLQHSFAKFFFSFAQNITDIHNLQMYMHSLVCYIHRFKILMKISSDVSLKYPSEGNSSPKVCSFVVKEL